MSEPLTWVAALALHALALGWIVRQPAPSSRRHLAVALACTVPLAGPLLAALALRLRGAGAPSLDDPIVELPPPPLDPNAIERLAGAPPALERICAGGAERRAVMAALARRQDPASVELLRWTIERLGGDAAVEAALALEDLTRRHEERLDHARAQVTAEPTAAAALEHGDAAAALIHNGIADPPLVPVLAAEARRAFTLAAELGAGAGDLCERRARLELAAMQPEAALEALAPLESPDPELHERLEPLRQDAAFAARCAALPAAR